MTDNKKNIGKQTPTIVGDETPNVPPPSLSSNAGRHPSSIGSSNSHSIYRDGVQTPNLSISRDRAMTKDRAILEMMKNNEGPEQIIHDAFVENFSKLFTLDPKSILYFQTLKDKLSKFSEFISSNGLMNTFLFAYSVGAVSSGMVRENVDKDYKTIIRYLAILEDIIPNFLEEKIKIPKGERYPSNVANVRVFRFQWSSQEPVINYYRSIQRKVSKEGGVENEDKFITETIDPRVTIIQLENEIKLIEDWFANPNHKKNQEKFQSEQKETLLKRIKELKREVEN